MNVQRKERYDYIKGNPGPSDTGLSPIPAPSKIIERSEQADLEAQTNHSDRKESKPSSGCSVCGCCCRCCCYLMVFIVLILIILGVLLAIFFPKPPKFKLKSFDMGSTVVYEVDNPNSYDIKVDHLFGDIQFRKERLVDFDSKDITILKKAKTDVEITLSNVNMSSDLAKHCMGNKDFKADVNMSINLALLRWLKKPIKRTEQVTIPCPKIPKVDLSKLPKDLDLNKLPPGTNQKDIKKFVASQK